MLQNNYGEDFYQGVHLKKKYMFLLDDHSCNLLTSLRLLGEKSEEKS